MQSPRPADPCDMRIFKGRYFNINRKLLMCLGLWPYGIKFKRYSIRIVALITLVMLCVPQLLDVILHTENVDRWMLGVNAFLSLFLMIIKISGSILSEEKMKEIHRRIANNWQAIEDEDERDLLHEYAERARAVTIFYFKGLMVSSSFACTLPAVPKILDELMPLGHSRPEICLLEGEYFIDKKAHFNLFFCINFLGITSLAFVSAVFESMFIVSVEHCCALYAIVRWRLLALRRMMQKQSAVTEDDGTYEFLFQTIQLHKNALSFNTLLSDSYTTAFGFMLYVGVTLIPLTGCAMIAKFPNLLHMIPYAMFLVAIVVQGFVFCFLAQRIIDHQLNLCDAAYCNEWYETPLRTRKLLVIFLIRCSVPAPIKAAGFCPLNLEFYSKVIKKALSYITVVSSFR